MSLNNIRLQDVRRLLRNAGDLELASDAVQKLKWFLYALEHDGNVSLTCRHFGISRSTLLRWIDRFDALDLRSLQDLSRRPHTVREPETDACALAIITEIRTAHPTIGKELVQEMLLAKYGIALSSSTVGRIINRHKLFFADTPSHREKRREHSEEETTASSPPRVLPVTLGDTGDLSDDPFLFPAFGVTS